MTSPPDFTKTEHRIFRACARYGIDPDTFEERPWPQQERILAREVYIEQQMEALRQAMITTRGAQEDKRKRPRRSDKIVNATDAYYMLLLNLI